MKYNSNDNGEIIKWKWKYRRCINNEISIILSEKKGRKCHIYQTLSLSGVYYYILLEKPKCLCLYSNVWENGHVWRNVYCIIFSEKKKQLYVKIYMKESILISSKYSQ